MTFRETRSPDDILWDTYLKASKSEDEVRPKNWEESTTGILTFTGLFAATVAGFVIESYRQLSPDPGDRTVVLLEQLFVAMANASSQNPIIVQPPVAFSAPLSAVITNVFWFLSLLIALICALLSTLVQEWTRNYVQDINRRKVNHETLRDRAFNHIFIRMGVNKYGMDQFVFWIVALVHLSVFLFVCGLVAFLFPIDYIVAGFSTALLVAFLITYIVASWIPLVDKSCPYRTPVTYLIAFVYWLSVRCRAVVMKIPSISKKDERLEDFNHVIMRQYDGEKSEFLLAPPRTRFVLEHAQIHISSDQSKELFDAVLVLVTQRDTKERAELLRILCADNDLMERLYKYLKRSAPRDHTNIFVLLAYLSKEMYANEVEHHGKHLEADALTSQSAYRAILWLSKNVEPGNPAKLSVNLCLTRARLSFLERCQQAYDNGIPPRRDKGPLPSKAFTSAFQLGDCHPSEIIYFLNMYSLGLGGDRRRKNIANPVPLHDDDCCRHRRNIFAPEGLTHVSACNILAAISELLNATYAQKFQSAEMFELILDAAWQSVHRLPPMPETSKQKMPSAEFVSMLCSVGLQSWLTPGSRFDDPTSGAERSRSLGGRIANAISPRGLKLLQNLAQWVNFAEYRARAPPSMIPLPLGDDISLLSYSEHSSQDIVHDRLDDTTQPEPVDEFGSHHGTSRLDGSLDGERRRGDENDETGEQKPFIMVGVVNDVVQPNVNDAEVTAAWVSEDVTREDLPAIVEDEDTSSIPPIARQGTSLDDSHDAPGSPHLREVRIDKDRDAMMSSAQEDEGPGAPVADDQ